MINILRGGSRLYDQKWDQWDPISYAKTTVGKACCFFVDALSLASETILGYDADGDVHVGGSVTANEPGQRQWQKD